MCTVTYLPYRKGFILTHNRDEAPTRSPQRISREQIGNDTLLFPKDLKAGGAWVAAARSGRTACLLNGAFVKHEHQPPYRRSRGLVLLDFFNWPDPGIFFERYVLEGIEPFTLLYFHPEQVVELRWDGQQRHLKHLLPGQAHFWCSSTLYTAAMQERREQVFQQWLQKHPPAKAKRLPSSAYHLHRTGSVGDPENDYIMNRQNRVRTVSVTQIVFQHDQYKMHYTDLLEGSEDTRHLSVHPSQG